MAIGTTGESQVLDQMLTGEEEDLHYRSFWMQQGEEEEGHLEEPLYMTQDDKTRLINMHKQRGVSSPSSCTRLARADTPSICIDNLELYYIL